MAAVAFCLVHVAHGAAAGAARVTTRSAGSRRTRSRSRWTLSGNGENGELRLKFPGMAFRTRSLLFAIDEGFEVVIAFLADVFENWHETFLKRSRKHLY